MGTPFLLSFNIYYVSLNALVFMKFVFLCCSNGSPTGRLVWVSITTDWVVTDASPLDQKKLKDVFIDRFFPLEISEAKVLEFIKLHQKKYECE